MQFGRQCSAKQAQSATVRHSRGRAVRGPPRRGWGIGPGVGGKDKNNTRGPGWHAGKRGLHSRGAMGVAAAGKKLAGRKEKESWYSAAAQRGLLCPLCICRAPRRGGLRGVRRHIAGALVH